MVVSIELYLLLDISDRAAQQLDKVRDSAGLNNVLCLERRSGSNVGQRPSSLKLFKERTKSVSDIDGGN